AARRGCAHPRRAAFAMGLRPEGGSVLAEPPAAELLVATYGDRAYRLASGIAGNTRDAEEVVQDAFWTVVGRSTRSGVSRPSAPGSTGSSPMPPTRSFAAGQVDVAKSRSMRCCRGSTRTASTRRRSRTGLQAWRTNLARPNCA